MIDSLEILQEAISSGIINVDSVQEQIMTKKHEKILKEHPYSIWEGRDSKWRTYIYDETKPKKRRMVKRTSKENIEDFIVEEYEKEQKKKIKADITIRILYPEWIKYKSLQVNSSSTIARINADWKKYYCNDLYNQLHNINIIDTPIKSLNFLTLDKWAHYIVKNGNLFPSSNNYKPKSQESNLSRKQYFNVSLIVRQILDYAVHKEIIESNPFTNVTIDKKLFRKVAKKSDESQVYLINEEHDLLQLLWKSFNQTKNDLRILAVILNFYLGLRVGELVALKRSDINGRYLHVQRQLVKEFIISEDNDTEFVGYKPVNFTKSVAGDRKIYLVDEAMKIIDIIISTLDNNYKNVPEYKQGFLFVKQDGFILPSNIDSVLVSYCKKLNISTKRSHKIRKTVISTLVDSGLNINTIREFAGHEDERTTFNNYTFNRLGNDGIENMLEKSLSKFNF